MLKTFITNKKVIIILLVLILLLSFLFYVRPYNSAEYNLATVYYMNYNYLLADTNDYVRLLNQYEIDKNEVHIEKALVKLDTILKDLQIFRICLMTNYRETIINQKLIKPELFSLEILNKLEMIYQSSIDFLAENLKQKNFDDKIFEGFVTCNLMIAKAMEPEKIGYYEDEKEFIIKLLDDDNTNMINGLNKLEEIIEKQ